MRLKTNCWPNVFICDECVELCMDIIKEEYKQNVSKTSDGVPTPVLLNFRRICNWSIYCKKNLSVAVHNHYKRLANINDVNDVEQI